MSSHTHSNSNVAARIEVVGGQPIIFIGDRMFALPAVDSSSTAALNSGSAMDSAAKEISELPSLSTHGSMSRLPFGPARANSTSPFAGLDLTTLKSQQAQKKQELRTVEQTEVLQASHQTEAWRAGIIEKKRCLIVELDALRKSITALENDNAISNSFLGPVGTVPGSGSLPSFVPQLQQPVPQAVYPFPTANPYAPMMMYQPPYSAFPSLPTAEPTPFVAAPGNLPHSPGSASRRSHAIEIKPPHEGTAKQTLNPRSPTYEPPTKTGSARSAAPPTPSPPKRTPRRTQVELHPGMVQHRAPSQRLSFSSIDTTDFFPTNTHEHSSTRLAPGANESKQTPADDMVVPLTPEKHWPASPWNEGNSGHSRKNEQALKLTSWPEAFGTQRSSSSLRQNAAEAPSTTVLERAPVIGVYVSNSASNSNALVRSDSEQRTGTDENWPFSRKAVSHVPSTYQEGYQAGYDHVGMPDSPEVLQGYIQGLMRFLSDESKKGRFDAPVCDTYGRGIDSHTPSLRGLVAGSMPHDSGVSMTFNRTASPSANHENFRTSKDSLSANMYRDSTYSPKESVQDARGSYALPNEAAYATRQRNVSSMQYANSVGPHHTKLTSGRPAGHPPGGNERGKSVQGEGLAYSGDLSFASGGFSRQFSGAQMQNRGYGTPLSNQRFYPTLKEMSPNGFSGDVTHSMRPFTDHRLSGLDGALDDMADLVMETHVNDNRASAGRRPYEAPVLVEVEAEEVNASCFKQSGGKGKLKATISPTKSSGNSQDNSVSLPNPPSSPKKPGELSPAKAKLEQVTNKFRRTKREDPRTMSPEDKMRRSEKWRQRFQAIKRTELEEIEEHRRNTRT
jgi:hypothetical protein